MNKVIDYISIPVRNGGFGALLGGTIALFIGEFLQKFGSITIGYYGGIPGFLIKISAFCLCFQYSSQVLRAFHSGAKTLPFWKTPSLNFLQLIESLFSIFISVIYAFVLTLIFYFICVWMSNKSFNFTFFFTHLVNYGFFVFLAIFFPAIFFLSSIAPDDLMVSLNPVLIGQVVIKSLPYYIILVVIAYLLAILFTYFRISLIFIGDFIPWFIKFYFLIFFALITGRIYAKINLIEGG